MGSMLRPAGGWLRVSDELWRRASTALEDFDSRSRLRNWLTPDILGAVVIQASLEAAKQRRGGLEPHDLRLIMDRDGRSPALFARIRGILWGLMALLAVVFGIPAIVVRNHSKLISMTLLSPLLTTCAILVGLTLVRMLGIGPRPLAPSLVVKRFATFTASMLAWVLSFMFLFALGR